MNILDIKRAAAVISLVTIFVFAGCKQEQKETAQAEQEEFKVWAVPNVPEGAEAYFSPDGKRLIYNAKMEGDESFYVYTLNVDGTDIKKINDKGEDACSFYHPDGKTSGIHPR